MSRTKHPYARDVKHTVTKQAPTSALTKNRSSSMHTPSVVYNNDGQGKFHFTDSILFQKEQKARKTRRIMKRHGRRVDRYAGRKEVE